jgi:hypothetical protein
MKPGLELTSEEVLPVDYFLFWVANFRTSFSPIDRPLYDPPVTGNLQASRVNFS